MNKNFAIKATCVTIVIFLLCCFTGCGVVDPIEGENSYAIENSSNETIQLIYTIVSDLGSWRAGKTDSVYIAPLQTYKFLIIHNDMPDWTPSHIFENMVILSAEKDTLHKMDIIDDNEWILTDSVKNYGYVVGYYHWLYKFSE